MTGKINCIIHQYFSNHLFTRLMLVVLVYCLIFIVPNVLLAANEKKPTRILLIGIDAIPYSLMRNLLNSAKSDTDITPIFKGFKGPTAVISTFPSNSHVAWSGLLQPFNVTTTAGYEGRYFNRHDKEITDGYSLFDDATPWQRYFNWRLEGIITTAFAYGWPEHFSLAEIDDGLEAFYASDERYFAMYIVSTDGIGHTKGPTALIPFIKALDQKLLDFKQRHADMPFYTVMISDHGMAGGQPLLNTYSAITEKLEKSGYTMSNNLNEISDVALISFGLLNSFVIYTDDEIKQEVANLVSRVNGVDLCVSPQETAWRVSNAQGYAMIHKKKIQAKTFWSYQVVSADPINYKNLLQTLQSPQAQVQQQWFSDQQWFEVSQSHHFPDALHRLAGGFELVANPASIICSVSPGYMFGSLLTEYVAIPTVGALQWTHGALHRNASLSFLMSDFPDWQAADMIRYNQALEFLNKKIHNSP